MRSALPPDYCPHLDRIERLWALMHQNITDNTDFKTFGEFRRSVITLLRHAVTQHWRGFSANH
jgi:hypothetical protein